MIGVCESSSSLIGNLTSYPHGALIGATDRPRLQIDPSTRQQIFDSSNAGIWAETRTTA